MKRELKMLFQTDNGSKVTYSLPDPKPGITKEEIKTAMEVVIEKNIFQSINGELVLPLDARVVETTEKTFDLKN